MSDLRIVGWTSFHCDYPTPKLTKEELNEVVELIKEELIENEYIFSGQDHQQQLTGVPVFSNGTCFRASMRCWGSILAEIYEGPNGENLSYMDFYMSIGCRPQMPEETDIDIEPAVVEVESPGCTLKQDRELIDSSIAYNMPLLTTDLVVNKLYEMKLKELSKKD